MVAMRSKIIDQRGFDVSHRERCSRLQDCGIAVTDGGVAIRRVDRRHHRPSARLMNRMCVCIP